MKLGYHASIAKGYLSAVKEAVSIGANTFQFFSRNPRGGSARELDLEDIALYKEFASKHNIETILAHAPYTLNAGSATRATREFAKQCLEQDLKTLASFGGGVQYVFHPGSHTTLTKEESITFVIDILNSVLTNDTSVPVLLEGMSGKGSELCGIFDELTTIISGVELSDKVGVCLDSCHLYSAGYDIVNNLDGVLEDFDKIVGLDKLKAFHLNDSMTAFASKKDRHAKIGEGTIGLDAIIRIITHKKLKHLPFYLETPNEIDGYQREIEILKSVCDRVSPLQ
ncbi:MAG: deoxyribonuclease IV [Firmicutes bacterium]|nr:deoxyribonuclease IV [Bacillota bacterium]